LLCITLAMRLIGLGLGFLLSTLFRFRSGARQPAEPVQFAAAVANHVAAEVNDPDRCAVLAELLDCAPESIADPEQCRQRVKTWLLDGHGRPENDVSSFLTKLDEFDLNEYIRSIRFDELKIPTLPFQLPTSRTVTGLRAMMDAELDFLKTTALSRSADPVILYSDMPMTEMARDPDFPKKWMFGMAALLKKGLHLHIIHNLDRSFSEMMLGLESHIPMYMTGQISPYYLKNAQNNIFLHFLKVSGSAALSGEAIAGHHAEGRYHLTSVKSDVEYYTRRANDLLRCAKPLMDIYREDGAQRLRAFLLSDAALPGPRRNILSAPPICTMDEPFLRDFLLRRHVSEEDCTLILDYARRRRDMMDAILSHDPVEDRLPLLSPEEFAAYPLSLPLSGLFYPRDLHYTYEDYQSHLDQTRRFAGTHPGYTATLSASHTFRNLEIQMHLGKWAMVSKGRSPAIHFVIHHPKLRAAIEDFVPPVVEA
ncbi:MAG: hypothetical protein EGQ40_05890, partial [Clostridiales bacterium]|nr:hypothetical protein [Clostridiales bacterium]